MKQEIDFTLLSNFGSKHSLVMKLSKSSATNKAKTLSQALLVYKELTTTSIGK